MVLVLSLIACQSPDPEPVETTPRLDASPLVRMQVPGGHVRQALSVSVFATDAESPATALSYRLSLAGETLCEGRATDALIECPMTMPDVPGLVPVTALVRDEDANVVEQGQLVSVVELEPPRVALLTGRQVFEGPVSLTSTIRAGVDGRPTLRLWSSVDGELLEEHYSSGEYALVTELRRGSHLLAAELVSPLGRSTIDLDRVQVYPVPPQAPLPWLDTVTSETDIRLDAIAPWTPDVQTRWLWSSGAEGSRIPAASTQRGQVLTLTVESITPAGVGTLTQRQVEILNSPPRIQQVSVVSTGTRLDCAATVHDADDDPIDLEYVWITPLGVAGVGPSLQLFPNSIGPWSCDVRASDGHVTTMAQTTLTAGNHPPLLEVSPLTTPTAVEDVTAMVDTSDPDGDTVELSWSWQVNGQPTHGDATLAHAAYVLGDRIDLTVEAYDGIDRSTYTVEHVFVRNQPPVAAVLAGPEPPLTLSDVRCRILQSATDPDGTPLHHRWAWPDHDKTSVFSVDDTLASAAWGETYTCTLESSDGELTSVASHTFTLPDCDADGDTFLSDDPRCGGVDCDDNDSAIHPWRNAPDPHCNDLDCTTDRVDGLDVMACTDPLTFEQAASACESTGGSLATPYDFPSTQTLDVFLANHNLRDPFWVGLDDGVWSNGLPAQVLPWRSAVEPGTHAVYTTEDALRSHSGTAGFLCTR